MRHSWHAPPRLRRTPKWNAAVRGRAARHTLPAPYLERAANSTPDVRNEGEKGRALTYVAKVLTSAAMSGMRAARSPTISPALTRKVLHHASKDERQDPHALPGVNLSAAPLHPGTRCFSR